MNATLRYVWLTAVRDRLFMVLAALAVLLFCGASLLGGAALVEGEAASLAMAAAAVRALVVLGLVVFVSFHVQRLLESREIESLLARPLRRGQFVLAYWLAGCSLGAALVSVPALGLLLMYPPSFGGWLLWVASLLLESMLVVALALTVALAFGSAVVATLATLAIYMLGRQMTFLLAVTGGQFGLAKEGGLAGPFAEHIMHGLAMLLPRLDLFGQSDWLVNGPDGGIGGYWFVAQALVYQALLLAVAAHDLRRREF